MIQPPTDNIYKFCAMIGLIVVIFSSYFTLIQIQNLRIEKIELNNEIQVFNVGFNYLSYDVRNLLLREESQKNNQNQDEIYEIATEHRKLIIESAKELEKFDGKKLVIDEKIFQIKIYLYGLIVIYIIFIPLSIFGFRKWYMMEK